MRTVPADARREQWKVERGGALVAYAFASLDWLATEPGRSECNIRVHPEHRGQGLGSALWDVVEAHLAEIGARATTSFTRDDALSVAFAERRGFRKTSTDALSATDPTGLPPAPEPPKGVTLRPPADWLGDPRPIYELDVAGGIDEPGDIDFSGMTFELWRDDIWSDPDYDYDISTLAVVDGKPVSMSMLLIDADACRAVSGFAATYREYRGRGLAGLCKHHTLAKAAARRNHACRHRQRRDERPDARDQPETRLPPVRDVLQVAPRELTRHWARIGAQHDPNAGGLKRVPSIAAEPRTSSSLATVATRVDVPQHVAVDDDEIGRRSSSQPPDGRAAEHRPRARGRVSQHVERRETRPAHEAQLFTVDTRRDARIAEVGAVEKGSARAHEGAGIGERRGTRVPPDVERADDLDPGPGDAPHEPLVALGGHVRQIVDADVERGTRPFRFVHVGRDAEARGVRFVHDRPELCPGQVREAVVRPTLITPAPRRASRFTAARASLVPRTTFVIAMP